MRIVDHELALYRAKILEHFFRLTNRLAQFPKAKVAAIVIVGVLSIVIIAVTHHRANPIAKTPVLMPSPMFSAQQRHELNSKLARLETKWSHPREPSELPQVKALMDGLSMQLKHVIAQSHALLLSEWHDELQKMEKQLNVLSAQIQTLQQRRQITYLKPQDLPFVITQIDNIQGQNIVTVNYDHTAFPLDNGDYLAGWKLISTDFSNQRAELLNAAGQHVIVTLKNVDPLITTGQPS